MALQIQGRPTEFCLKNCLNMELDVDSQTMYADGEPYHIETKVSCRYEKICKRLQNLAPIGRSGAAGVVITMLALKMPLAPDAVTRIKPFMARQINCPKSVRDVIVKWALGRYNYA